jgi:hypothetical protein
MAFLAPLLGSAGGAAGTAAGGIAKGATAAAGALGKAGALAGGALGGAGKAVSSGFSSIIGQGDPAGMSSIAQGAPAVSGGSTANAMTGAMSPDVMGETPGLQPMQDTGFMSKLSGFLDSPLGQTLREGASQGRGMDLFGNTDMGASAQLSRIQPSQQRDVLAFLQQYMNQRR